MVRANGVEPDRIYETGEDIVLSSNVSNLNCSTLPFQLTTSIFFAGFNVLPLEFAAPSQLEVLHRCNSAKFFGACQWK